jgi:predicted branched-subunit amino acid permease
LARANSLLVTSVSVGLATGLYGISFGALSVAAGLDVWQTCVLSLLMFSGGSQFAFVGVIAGGGVAAIPAAIASAWMMGVRNGFYAVAMAPILQLRKLKRVVSAQLTIDESTGVALSQAETSKQKFGFWATGISVFVFWNLLTLLGALLGELMSDPAVWGLDAAAAAAFVALVWPRLNDSPTRVVAVLAVAVAILSSPYVPQGVPVLLAGLVAVAVWATVGLREQGGER